MEREEIVNQLGGIKLVNIDLSKVSLNGQAKKVAEEDTEFYDALQENEFNGNASDHMVEEFWDIVQSRLGLLEKHGITAEDVMHGYSKHLEKIKNRPRD